MTSWVAIKFIQESFGLGRGYKLKDPCEGKSVGAKCEITPGDKNMVCNEDKMCVSKCEYESKKLTKETFGDFFKGLSYFACQDIHSYGCNLGEFTTIEEGRQICAATPWCKLDLCPGGDETVCCGLNPSPPPKPEVTGDLEEEEGEELDLRPGGCCIPSSEDKFCYSAILDKSYNPCFDDDTYMEGMPCESFITCDRGCCLWKNIVGDDYCGGEGVIFRRAKCNIYGGDFTKDGICEKWANHWVCYSP